MPGRSQAPRKVAESAATYAGEMNREELIRVLEKEMTSAAEAMDFERAARIRDEIFELKAAR